MWAPDGLSIVFASNRGGGVNVGQIYRVRPDGTGLERLTQTPFSKAQPSFSADGKSLYLYENIEESGFEIGHISKIEIVRRRCDDALTGNAATLPVLVMSDEPPESLIPYDEIVQEALRDVVGRVLGQVERTGALPGEHHFYITFKTKLPGVSIPKHLTERFPDEMTIVLQHRFWDLKVGKDEF